ncbi:MAG: Maf family protein [Actinomycetes bacterium]
MRLILASASPARLQTLQAAGVDVSVHVSGVDESSVTEGEPVALASALARLKGEAVLAERGTASDAAIIACDSVLWIDGEIQGKPHTDAEVRARWQRMRGRTGTLITGHHLVVVRAGEVTRVTQAASTSVTFADVTDAELDAYVATGEPHQCAGAFTIDGYGGAFVEGLEGDPHNVVGISLPLLRRMLAHAGLSWVSFWRPTGTLERP